MSDLTARIRAFLASGDNAAAHTPVNEALHDVLAACEEMRRETESFPGWANAEEIEKAIAKALGIDA